MMMIVLIIEQPDDPDVTNPPEEPTQVESSLHTFYDDPDENKENIPPIYECEYSSVVKQEPVERVENSVNNEPPMAPLESNVSTVATVTDDFDNSYTYSQ